ncbi:MAG: beta-lactamase family protein [Roseivirga sp.]|nr:beta-lactamase family protein [Roseivirga sp.]
MKSSETFWRRFFLPLCFLLFVFSVPLQAQVNNPETLKGSDAETIHKRLIELQSKGFSGSILVEKEGEIILKSGYGFANRDKRIPFKASTISTIGSITKPLTATAILKLEEEGKLRLTDPLSKYIPNLDTKLQSITLDQLLTHRSGLGSILTQNDFKNISREDFINRLNKLNLKFEPGSKVAYSNIGFSVLAMVIEQVSGSSYEQFLQTHFFKPLSMKNTGYTAHDWLEDSVATGYRGSKEWGSVYQKVKNMEGNFWNLIGNGGMHMNLNDMYKWYRAMKDKSIISEEIKSKLLSPHVKCGPKSVTCYQGYAWVVLHLNEGKDLVAVTHSGGNNIFYADFWWYPEEDIFLAMLTNNSKFPAEDISRDLISILRK